MSTDKQKRHSPSLRCDGLVRLLREKSCGDISCEDCNAQRRAAADEIEKVQGANLIVGPISAVEVKHGYALVAIEVDYESGLRIIAGQMAALLIPPNDQVEARRP